MRGFRERAEVADVEAMLLRRVAALAGETVETIGASGRILCERISSPVAVPAFDRSAMDGYALRGEETFGAEAYSPLRLRVIGESLPGRAFAGTVGAGETVRIMTGAPMPSGADAVLMAEDATVDGDHLDIAAPVPPKKNVSACGEDVRAGDVLLEAGRRLRPQDLGVLLSTGIAQVLVHRRPRVDILVTGNELLPAGAAPQGHRIVDANSPILQALVDRDGGEVVRRDIVADDLDTLRAAIRGCAGDAILVSGGSSVGKEDFVPQVVGELGELAVHGIAMRPSSPAGVGFIGGRPLFLLPGNPVSCLCAYDFFAGPSIRALGGRARDWPYRSIVLPLSRKIASESGRVDYARVRVVDGRVEPLMISGASILSSTTRADGFVIVPRDSEGFSADDQVTVHLYG
ncbi:MAG: molybdopterin molybdotransferase MoeA [Planctomycetes bacterium]|nr:molybdopterin molybdotransferase MoeA [Planctomycetota bacterium]